MKSLLWLLAVFAAAVAFVFLGRIDAGYVLFIVPPWRVETGLIFFAVATTAAFLLLYLGLRLLGHTLALPATVRAYRVRRRRERAEAALAAALQAYYEGRFARAEKEAAAAFEDGPAPSSGAGARSPRSTSCSRASPPPARATPPRSAAPRSRAALSSGRSPPNGARSSCACMASCRGSSRRAAPRKRARASSAPNN